MARPRTFDREQALERAMDTFWDLGYESTSTADLVDRMGIARSSLYATFGSKEQLYAEALDLYVSDLRHRVIAELRQPGPAMPVLERFFDEVSERGRDGQPQRCCLLVRASLAGGCSPHSVRHRVRSAVGELDDAFRDLLGRARDEGSVVESLDLGEAARFLTATFQGLNIAAQVGRTAREQRDIVRQALAGLRTRRQDET